MTVKELSEAVESRETAQRNRSDSDVSVIGSSLNSVTEFNDQPEGGGGSVNPDHIAL